MPWVSIGLTEKDCGRFPPSSRVLIMLALYDGYRFVRENNYFGGFFIHLYMFIYHIKILASDTLTTYLTPVSKCLGIIREKSGLSTFHTLRTSSLPTCYGCVMQNRVEDNFWNKQTLLDQHNNWTKRHLIKLVDVLIKV